MGSVGLTHVVAGAAFTAIDILRYMDERDADGA